VLWLRRRRRRLQVRRTAAEGVVSGGRPVSGAAGRHHGTGSRGGARRAGGSSRTGGPAQAAGGCGRVLPRAPGHAGGRAGAAGARESRNSGRNSREIRVRLRAGRRPGYTIWPVCGPEGSCGAADPEWSGRRARRGPAGGPFPEPSDDSNRARVGRDCRVWRARARCGAGAEVPELARDADLHQGPHALRTRRDEGRDPEARLLHSR